MHSQAASNESPPPSRSCLGPKRPHSAHSSCPPYSQPLPSSALTGRKQRIPIPLPQSSRPRETPQRLLPLPSLLSALALKCTHRPQATNLHPPPIVHSAPRDPTAPSPCPPYSQPQPSSAFTSRRLGAYIEQMGLAPFVNMSWADPNSAPRMQLIEEFINGAVHHPDRMEAEVDGKTCVIDVALITRFLHLPIGDMAEILAEPELDRRRLIKYQGLEPKQPGGYSITQGHQNHILHKRVFIQTFMFKRKPTYISENAIRQWVSAEILANKGEMWGWALCMFKELVKEVKECKKGCTTICVSAEVLDRLLDLYFPHSTHPTQKAAAQREDDLRRAKENERNRFNGPNYLILRRSPVHIVDEAGPSSRTEPVPDATDPLPTPEQEPQPTPRPQTSLPDNRPRPHPRDRAKEIATS